jgi:arginyl-tRNA synthetase
MPENINTIQEMIGFISGKLAPFFGADADDTAVRKLLTRPPDADMGDLAFPCFPLAKLRKQAPQRAALELCAQLEPDFAARGMRCEAAGPYLNFRFNRIALAHTIQTRALAGELLSDMGAPSRTAVIDFSSPNIAKPFSMGHLRSTSIGSALARMYQALGWRVVRVNHLGDWGTQFGKLIVAFRLWGDTARLEKEGIPYLMELYVRVNDEAKARPELDGEARAAFKQLEDGNDEARTLWKVFREVSLAEFERIYAILGVSFDSSAGESFYNDKIESAITVLEDARLLAESEGALVVSLDDADRDEPPCMIRKSDGASTYAARDLAAIFYRWREYAFDRLLYVVGAPQALHFKQVFCVLKKLGLPYADRCVHVPFGQILFNGEMMSTRKGNVIFLEDVIKEAEEKALAKMLEDDDADGEETSREERRRRARILAVSSIIFYDLKNGRIKDVDFNWEEILNPHGETGIYLQYAHARIHGILRKAGERLGLHADEIYAGPPPVTEKDSWPIFDQLSRFQEKLELAVENNEPSIVSRFLLDLASVFSAWYRGHKVVNEDDLALSRERLAAVLSVREVLRTGLGLLGIEPLEKM